MKSSLIIHARTHTGEKHYNCSYCNKDILKNDNNLTNHKRTHTGEKHYSCSHCVQSFADSSFRRHQIIHSHCNKAFAQKKTSFYNRKKNTVEENIQLQGTASHWIRSIVFLLMLKICFLPNTVKIILGTLESDCVNTITMKNLSLD